jgi:tetratricopeptide (TPR) repeat protein
MKFILFFLAFVFAGGEAVCSSGSQVMALQVFGRLKSKTGLWNINIEIPQKGKYVILDKSNTIFIPEQVLDICYENHSVEEGDNRLAFLLAHEFAHIMNNDLDYDRILNPFNNKLTNEPLEIRRQKEINADLRAISILNIGGFATSQFDDSENNIIADIYRFYGITDLHKNFGSYPSASDRVRNINARKEVLQNYNRLYESGLFMLLFADEKANNILCDYAIDAFQSFQNYTSLTTPELLNNLGLCYLKTAKANFSRDFLETPDTIDFMKFETGYLVSSEVKPLRSAGLLNSSAAEKKKIDKLKYQNNISNAEYCFREADRIADNDFLPARLNRAALSGMVQNYNEANGILDEVYKKKATELEKLSLTAYYFNLKGITEYCLGRPKDAAGYFDKAFKLNPEYTTSLKNKRLAAGVQQNLPAWTDKPPLSSPSLADCIYNTFGDLSLKDFTEFTFGPKEIYKFRFAETDSLKQFIIRESDSYKRVEFIKVTRGGLKGKYFLIGAKKSDVFKELSGDFSIIFSTDKTHYYFKNQGIIFSFDKTGILTEMIILNRMGVF